MGKRENIKIEWKSDLNFNAEVNGHKIEIDADSEVGGKNKGPRPKPLMLVALAGCTGMDVVSILKKMKVNLKELNIDVEAELTEEHPKYYNKMKVIYNFKGENLKKEKIEKAVNLSKERYCGVSAFYKKVIDIDYEIRIGN